MIALICLLFQTVCIEQIAVSRGHSFESKADLDPENVDDLDVRRALGEKSRWTLAALKTDLSHPLGCRIERPLFDGSSGKIKMQQLIVIGVVATVLVYASSAGAQQTTADQDSSAKKSNQSVPVVKASAASIRLGFRVTDWKTFHSDSNDEAKQQVATLMKIGCEVRTENHGDHIDVRYRCVDWKTLKPASNQLVNQWTTWCQGKGMETVVVNPPAKTRKPTVRFRLLTTKTAHLHDPDEAAQVISTLKLIGCKVASNNHGNHMDAKFSCPNWTTIELSSDENAHTWQKWLDESGFETEHSH